MKGKIVFISIFMCMFMISNLFAATTTGPNIQIVSSQVTPEPVEPGNDVTLKVNILNSGDEMAENVNVNIDAKSPFKFKESDFTKKDFGICGGCSYEATYYLTVASDAKSGIYPINFEINYGSSFSEQESVFVNIIGVPDILIDEKGLENKELYAGEKFEIDFLLENMGTGNAKNIKVSSGSEDIINIGANTKYLDSLNIGENKNIGVIYTINPDIDSGLYKLPINLEYFDELGNKHSDIFQIGIEVLDRAEINLQSLKIEPNEVKIFNEVLITGMIENSGSGDASNVYVTVETDLEGYKKSFIGSLENDEDSPFIFKLKSKDSGVHEVKLNIFYTDDFGEHMVTENIEINYVKPTSKAYTFAGIFLVLFSIIGLRHILKNKK